MPNTQGFDVVAELTQPALLSILQAMSDSDLLKKNLVIPVGLQFGSYTTNGGSIQAPKSGLAVQFAPPDSLNLQFTFDIQVLLQNPPVPSAGMIPIKAQLSAKVKVGNTPGKQDDVALLFGSVTLSDITVNLVGGDPFAQLLQGFITDFVHQQWQNNGPSFPHRVDKSQSISSPFGQTYTMQTTTFIMDSVAPNDIQVTFPPKPGNPAQAQLMISIPIYLKIYNIQPSGTFLDPMGVEARLVITTDLVQTPGTIAADLTLASVSVVSLVPAGTDHGSEGPNFTANNKQYGGLLTPFLEGQIQQQGQALVSQMQSVVFAYPTPATVQSFLAQQFLAALNGLGVRQVWPGTATRPPQLQVNIVTPVVLADVLAFGMQTNPGAANAGALANFVPPGKLFAIAVSADKTMTVMHNAINKQFPALPTVIPHVHGHDVRLESLNPSLTSALHFSGDVTVLDVTFLNIDVGAGYDVDVGLEWLPPDAKGQMLQADPGDPDVDLSTLTWLLSIISGFLTVGVVGVVIAVIVDEIVEGIASNIGGQVVNDQVTNAVAGLGAWPSPLAQVGEVKSSFENPIGIDSDGLLIQG